MLGMRGKLRKSNMQKQVCKQSALGENGAGSPGVTPECPACCLDAQRNHPDTDQQCDLCSHRWCT